MSNLKEIQLDIVKCDETFPDYVINSLSTVANQLHEFRKVNLAWTYNQEGELVPFLLLEQMQGSDHKKIVQDLDLISFVMDEIFEFGYSIDTIPSGDHWDRINSYSQEIRKLN